MPLLEFVQCEPGAPLPMLLDIRRDGIPTQRVSTYLRELRKSAGRADCGLIGSGTPENAVCHAQSVLMGAAKTLSASS